MTNELQPAPAPNDAAEWEAVIAGVSPLLVVWLVNNERGKWRVSKADDPPPIHLGGPPVPNQPPDRIAEVRQALIAAGKPVE